MFLIQKKKNHSQVWLIKWIWLTTLIHIGKCIWQQSTACKNFESLMMMMMMMIITMMMNCLTNGWLTRHLALFQARTIIRYSHHCLSYVKNRIGNCKDSEFQLCLMKLFSNNYHYAIPVQPWWAKWSEFSS